MSVQVNGYEWAEFWPVDYQSAAERMNAYQHIGRFRSAEPDGIPEAIKLLERHGYSILPPGRRL